VLRIVALTSDWSAPQKLVHVTIRTKLPATSQIVLNESESAFREGKVAKTRFECMFYDKELQTPADRSRVLSVTSIAQQGKSLLLLDMFNNRIKCVEVSDVDEAQVRVGHVHASEFEWVTRDQFVSGLCTLDERTLIVVVRNVAVASRAERRRRAVTSTPCSAHCVTLAVSRTSAIRSYMIDDDVPSRFSSTRSGWLSRSRTSGTYSSCAGRADAQRGCIGAR
jgi:hypothetical protein